jgi:probable F420-dependent oxidoreductase
MKIGIVVRNMGPQSQRETLLACARAVDETAEIADLWVVDHIAIPPDDAEGSDGRYLDPLATLAFLAGSTTRAGLGTAVLVVPYRPPLPTAKWLATIQELSAGRLLLGVGVGWMAPEFRALGIDRRRRGAITDETLDFLDRCFAGDDGDVVELNGQPFLFRPRPARPPLFIGGNLPHAFRRVLAHAGGWLPVGLDPDRLKPQVAALREQAAAAGGGASPEVAVMTTLPLDDPAAAADLVARYADAGATRIIHGARYADASAFRTRLDRLAEIAAGAATIPTTA